MLQKLQARIEELERAEARQTAPFRRLKRTGPGRLGRPPGFRGRSRPQPPHIDREVEVPLPTKECPDCHARLDRTPLVQIIEEIPPIRPEVTRLTTWSATCPCCNKQWHTSHPLQVSRARGAAAVHLGPRATALATLLKIHFGLPLRKTNSILKQGFGLSLSSSGLTQLLHRTAGKAQATYDELLEKLRQSPAVYADETSWYVGAPGHWLWVFTTHEQTIYHVDKSHGGAVAQTILGPAFDGVLVTDCAAIYRKVKCRQHKCIAHHVRQIAKLREREDTPDKTYLDAWHRFWIDVIDLTQARARDDLPADECCVFRGVIQIRLEELLAQEVTQVGDRKFRTRMRNARRDLLGCLDYQVEATNNRAERAIRPAVIARKLSCGNRTPRGAHTWEILASCCTSLYQHAPNLLSPLTQLTRLEPTLAG